ncbi:MAG: PspA/IM30 family protein [Candidatus Binatia bacterium]
MLGAFKRLFKVAQAEAHSVVDKLEDPIKLTEQGIRDLKKDLNSSLKGLAEVKALTIRLKKEQAEKKQVAADYERKAMLLLESGQKGKIKAEDADRLAGEALSKKEAATKQAITISKGLRDQDRMVAQLEANVKKLKSQVNNWENELTTLRARSRVASATKKLNQQLAGTASDSTIGMLEKMKSKVQEDEALAESYGEIAMVETNVDTEINQALAGEADSKTSESLAELKKKMGLSE